VAALLATGSVSAYLAVTDLSGLGDLTTTLATRYAPIHKAQAAALPSTPRAPVEVPAAPMDTPRSDASPTDSAADELEALRRANAALNARLARLEAALAAQAEPGDRSAAPTTPAAN
jgi:hypothetical protein